MAESDESKTSTPTGKAPASTDYWGWLSTAQKNMKDFVEVAGKVTQEKAAALVKHAEDMRQNYDMELATSILMSTVGGPVDSRAQAAGLSKKLTKQAVRELDMTYVTENIMTMSFPCDFESGKGTQSGNDIDVVSAFLKKRHEGRFMIWNISEESYDYSKFADQVLEYKFPGHPSPPLGLLFKICTSVESWLDADERNIAIIHCLTGKGRTAALVACVMAWIGEFPSPMEALQYIADRRKISVDYLTIPSQRRYIQYFSNMLDGVKPRSEPLLLRRVILNCIPVFGSDTDAEGGNQGCCPYIQLFKNGKLIATAAAQGESHSESAGDKGGAGQQQKTQLRWIKTTEGSASFSIDCPVQGDILLRCRHVAASGVRVSMFRTGFHTGYVPSGVLRLTKAQLDGASSDPRYDDDFFVDLIFSPIQPASNISSEDINKSATVPGESSSCTSTSGGPTLTMPTPDPESAAAHITDNGLTVEASSADKFELTLHKDAKFWDSVSNRKQRAKKRKARKFLSSQQERFSIGDDFKGDEDDAGVTEVNFYSSFTSPDSALGGKEGGKSNVSGLSDLDLIMQLAELESGASSGGGGGGAPVASSSASSEQSSTTTHTPNPTAAELLSCSNNNNNNNNNNSNISSGSISGGNGNGGGKNVNTELQVLEELERELGLDSLTLAPATSSIVKSASAPKQLSDDENLDELEKYLQSL
eukprot:CAMPEP_0170449960 /NCGR_PEP_ID=MMETSP0117_2-20130122/51522_1 /TAXON_ID=400756 /ORGANISM="Durinskia baltica, Strain CSIRO CS-38" /LENGTH=702 /DNA_ID=CAMNT_0010711235 /DNA_START=35 /DNA_END=2140 /DNA_ORIENTATION=+